jgi:hypothetical protein
MRKDKYNRIIKGKKQVLEIMHGCIYIDGAGLIPLEILQKIQIRIRKPDQSALIISYDLHAEVYY